MVEIEPGEVWSVTINTLPDGRGQLVITTDCPNGRVTYRNKAGTSGGSLDTDGTGTATAIASSPASFMAFWGGDVYLTTTCGTRHTLHGCPAGQHWDGTSCVPDVVTPPPGECDPGFHKDEFGNCVLDVPPTTELDEALKKLPNPLIPGEVFTWLGKVIGAIGHIIISIPGNIASGIWAAIPKSITNWFTAWTYFFAGVKEFFTTPGEFYRKHAVAMFESGSDSAIGTYAGGTEAEFERRLIASGQGQGLSGDIVKDIRNSVEAAGDAITSPFDTPVTVAEADSAARGAAIASLTAISAATVINVVAEMFPTVNATGLAFMTGALLQSAGIGGYLSDYFSKKYDANIGTQLGYYWNEKYQNKIESMSSLISKRRKGLISNEEFTRDGVRVTGQTAESVRLDYKDSLALPGLEDVLTYHFRHPTEPLDLGALQDWLGINYMDYRKYFDERQFSDVSIRFIQSAANLLNFTEPQVRELLRLNRLDPRTNSVLMMSPLDVAVKVVMQRQGDYLKPPEKKPEPEKHFTYSLLIKLAEAGEDITPFMPEDLIAEGWSQARAAILEDYIKLVVAAKAAKTAAKTLP